MPSDSTSWLEEHRGLVVKIADSVAEKYRLRRLMDDLVAFGHEGLLEARDRFDPDKGTAFTTFAWYRIRGRILDGCRDMGVLTRQQGKTVKVERAVLERQEARAHSAPTHPEPGANRLHEVAEALDEMVVETAAIVMLHEPPEDADRRPAPGPGPDRQAERRSTAAFVRSQVRGLDDDDRRVLQMSYYDGKTLDDIAEVFGCSKSWASRMRRTRRGRTVRRCRQTLLRRPRRAMALAVLVLALLVLGCTEPVASDLNRQQADALAALLESRGIASEVETSRGGQERWSVRVAEEDASAARAIAVGWAQRTAPRRAVPETNESTLLGPNRAEMHRRALERESRELAVSLEQLRHVARARVHPGIAESVDPRHLTQEPAVDRVSVMLIMSEDAPEGALEKARASAIALVTGVFPDVESADVTLIAERQPPLSYDPVALDQLGPWRVARGSAATLRWVAAAMIVVVLLSLVATAGLLLRLRRVQRELAELRNIEDTS